MYSLSKRRIIKLRLCSYSFENIALLQSDTEDGLGEDLEECYGEELDGNNCEDIAEEDYEGLEEDDQDHREEDGEISSETAPSESLVSLFCQDHWFIADNILRKPSSRHFFICYFFVRSLKRRGR